MQVSTGDLKRVFVGKDVLGILALLLLTSGAGAAVFVDAAVVMASAVTSVAPLASGTAVDLLVVTGIYLQAVVAAAVYRTARGTYRTLQRRARRAGSA